MKDPSDKKTLPLPLEPVRKRGRPALGNKAMSAAQRKSEQIARTRTKVSTSDEGLTDSECLYVLSAAAWPAGSAIDKDAFMQLGRLRGYLQQLDDDQQVEMPMVAAVAGRSSAPNLD